MSGRIVASPASGPDAACACAASAAGRGNLHDNWYLVVSRWRSLLAELTSVDTSTERPANSAEFEEHSPTRGITPNGSLCAGPVVVLALYLPVVSTLQ